MSDVMGERVPEGGGSNGEGPVPQVRCLDRVGGGRG